MLTKHAPKTLLDLPRWILEHPKKCQNISELIENLGVRSADLTTRLWRSLFASKGALNSIFSRNKLVVALKSILNNELS